MVMGKSISGNLILRELNPKMFWKYQRFQMVLGKKQYIIHKNQLNYCGNVFYHLQINPGDLVVDPFGGSGTTYAVAEAFNRKWAGSETDAEYCKIIKERVTDTIHLSRISSGKDEVEARERRRKLRVQ